MDNNFSILSYTLSPMTVDGEGVSGVNLTRLKVEYKVVARTFRNCIACGVFLYFEPEFTMATELNELVFKNTENIVFV